LVVEAVVAVDVAHRRPRERLKSRPLLQRKVQRRRLLRLRLPTTIRSCWFTLFRTEREFSI
jgi:hypothetical protein